MLGSPRVDDFLEARAAWRAISIGAALVLAALVAATHVLRRRDPELAARIARRQAARRAAESRPYGSTARALFGMLSGFSAGVTVLSGLFFVEAQDFRLFIAIVLLPAAYLTLVFGYLAVSGKRTSFPDAVLWLLPW
jgi:hypothetical protein